jgi:hypothetical protein
MGQRSRFWNYDKRLERCNIGGNVVSQSPLLLQQFPSYTAVWATKQPLRGEITYRISHTTTVHAPCKVKFRFAVTHFLFLEERSYTDESAFAVYSPTITNSIINEIEPLNTWPVHAWLFNGALFFCPSEFASNVMRSLT